MATISRELTGATMAISFGGMSAEPADFGELPVWSDPERLGGRLCFRGTRVPLDALFANLEAGVSLGEFLEEFAGVTREQAVAVLEYARRLMQSGGPAAA